jgi:hypothetical protein
VEHRVSADKKVLLTEKALADVEEAKRKAIPAVEEVQEPKPIIEVLEEREVKATSDKPKRKRATRTKTTKSKPTRRSTTRRSSTGPKRAKNKGDE